MQCPVDWPTRVDRPDKSVDHGPEFEGQVLDALAYTRNVQLSFIRLSTIQERSEEGLRTAAEVLITPTETSASHPVGQGRERTDFHLPPAIR